LGFFSIYKAAMLFSFAAFMDALIVAKICVLFSSSCLYQAGFSGGIYHFANTRGDTVVFGYDCATGKWVILKTT